MVELHAKLIHRSHELNYMYMYLHPGKMLMLFCRLLIFFQNIFFFRKFLPEIPSHCQTAWVRSKLFARVISNKLGPSNSFMKGPIEAKQSCLNWPLFGWYVVVFRMTDKNRCPLLGTSWHVRSATTQISLHIRSI